MSGWVKATMACAGCGMRDDRLERVLEWEDDQDICCKCQNVIELMIETTEGMTCEMITTVGELKTALMKTLQRAPVEGTC